VIGIASTTKDRAGYVLLRQAPDRSLYLLADAQNGQILRVTPASNR
jgi:glucose/arabinose dehydrogenase